MSGFDANPPTSRRIYGKQISLKVFWFTLEVWFEIKCLLDWGHGISWSHNKVKANDVCAQNLTNTQVVNAPAAGSLRVRQL